MTFLVRYFLQLQGLGTANRGQHGFDILLGVELGWSEHFVLMHLSFDVVD